MNHPSYPTNLKITSNANTWPEFIDLVRGAREALGNPQQVWYRGISYAYHRLIPSLLRHDDGLQKEKALFNEYQRTAARLLPDRRNDWELLFDMQHYGIPTRLLDWTDVLGVAVAFALYDSKSDNNPSAIYILDPQNLNGKSGRSGVVRPANESDFNYKSIYWENKPFKALYPIAIDSAFQSSRIAAQSGCFTVHGSEIDFFWDGASDCLRVIILNPGAKQGAREFLEHANLNAFTLYPDIVGMSRYIVQKYF